MKLAFTLTGVVFMFGWGSAQASFVDDGTELSKAIPAIRSAIGNRPRILRIEVEPNVVIVEAQDQNNLTHVNRLRCVNHIGIIPIQWVFGPEPVDLQLLDPDLEANLFDLDAVAFSATAKLEKAAVERTHIQERAVVTRMEVARQTFILPKPTTSDVRWTLQIKSGGEHADVFANAQGDIIGADISDTQRAQTLSLFKEPQLLVDAAAACRSSVGADPVLTSVGISAQSVSFLTNIADNRLGKLGGGLAQVANFAWNLNGLHSGLPGIDSSAITQRLTQAPVQAPFSVNDVDWSIVAKLEADSLAKVKLSQAQITGIKIEKSSSQPGEAVLAWTIKITDAEGEETSVVADTKGGIQCVALPESRRPKVVWTDPATLAGAIGRIGTTFAPNTKIPPIVADDRG